MLLHLVVPGPGCRAGGPRTEAWPLSGGYAACAWAVRLQVSEAAGWGLGQMAQAQAVLQS